ncbi:aldose 1-epimerase [Ciceribacter lividus]|uniref:Aldose 1-epimerase n=1 Tax=Ciceribacter lividus TaxID=1197950 RepID=A0A6I7HK69_9HYPH|nr:aldose epimerase family protein [Ciceribacter lividus]RCW20622.1 aldose 1-epimerase [Ciceribacter lividus]
MTNGATLVLEGSEGLRAEFSRCGARLLRLDIPVRDGGSAQVVIGSALDASQPDGDTWGGTICGRFANRIADASFELDGVRYSLPANHGTSSLHGGPKAFGLRDWNVEATGETLTFSLTSADGEMGYPGTMEVVAVYGLSGTTLWLEMTATTDKPTVVNLTQHAYWNLKGEGNVLSHELEIPASRYSAVDDRLIPLGAPDDVTGTVFDFRSMRTIGQIYDHSFCLDAGRGALHLGAKVREPETGRTMEVWTTEPAIQLYTANHFSEAMVAPFSKMVLNGAIALEPQTYPNAPNEPSYPSAVLRPGETYRHRIEWRFSGF